MLCRLLRVAGGEKQREQWWGFQPRSRCDVQVTWHARTRYGMQVSGPKKSKAGETSRVNAPKTSVCMLVCQPVGSSSSDRRMDAYLLPQCRTRHGPGSVKHAALPNTNGDGDRRLNLYVSPQPERAGPAGGRPAWLSGSQHPLDATTEDSYSLSGER